MPVLHCLWVALFIVSLVGCRMASPFATETSVPTMGQSAGLEVPPLRGAVLFAARSAQATMADIAVAASVSLIDTATNTTVATTLTNASGQFVLTFSGGFKPSTTTTYYLEAFKGLQSNRPGNTAARVRTIARFNGGWSTITSGSIVLNSSTTALSIGAALLDGSPTPFNFDSLIGSVVPGSPDVYTPVPGLTNADYTTLLNLVKQGLAADRDPVGTTGLHASTHTWIQVGSTITATSVTPPVAQIGDTVIVAGSGFSATPGANIVRFNGAPAVVTASDGTTLTTSVPSGAISGQMTVQVGDVVCMGPLFQVKVLLTGFSPTSGSTGTSVTISGSGFDSTTLANNVVSFNGTPATVTSVTATSITATVPSGAATGKISVVVGGSRADTSSNFTMPMAIASFTPLGGPAGTSVVLSGNGFSSVAASNSVTFNGMPATITSASPTRLTVTAPASTNGKIAVTVSGQTVTSTANYSYNITPGPGAGATIQTFAGAKWPLPGCQATNWGLSAQSVAIGSSNAFYILGSGTLFKVSAGIISRVAGNGTYGYSGDNGPATSAQLGISSGVALDGSGNLYIADTYNNRIRKVDTSGVITTFAGNGTYGNSGDNGPAIAAQLYQPYGVAVDTSGNVFIADTNNSRIRKVDAGTGIITTVAGSGPANTGGFSGDNMPATTALLSYPRGLTVDGTGNVYIADTGNARIRKVDTSGTITTVAGNGASGSSGDGGAATGAQLNFPNGVAVDGTGNVYIADTFNNRIRKVDTSGIITTFAGSGTGGYPGDNGPAIAAQLSNPYGVAVDGSGNLYVADSLRVRMVSVGSGTITTVAGNGSVGCSGDNGPATGAQMKTPNGVAVDGSGNVYIADFDNARVRKVDTSGTITTLAGTGAWGYGGDNGPATSAQLAQPTGVATDAAGNVYIADSYMHRIRKVDALGTITTFAGSATSGGAGRGGGAGYSGDGSAATSAKLSFPSGVAVDGSGNVYIADTGNNRIRKVDTSGIITTFAGNGTAAYSGDNGPAIAAQLSQPYGVAVDGAGNVYIADTFNNRIRKVDTSGTITTVAGTGTAGYSGDAGAATGAQLCNPYGVAVDGAGNLYVADYNNQRIRKVDTSGIITTVAGTGAGGYSGDGGAATGAQLCNPYGVAVDASGTLYIGDSTNNSIRKVR